MAKIHKTFHLFRMQEEGAVLSIVLGVSKKGSLTYVDAYTTKETLKRGWEVARKTNKEKIRIRNRDKKWVANNIPSSIWWHCEIHHDWANGGIMYFLTHEEHLIRTRKERINIRQRSKK